MLLRHQKLLAVALTCVGATTPACGDTHGARSEGDAGAPATPDGSEFAARDPAELFAWAHVPTFEATLPPERWSHLKSHAVDEAYEPAEVQFEGKSLGTVGLRFKGSIGTLSSCFDAQGRMTCAKLSMKLGFDKYEPQTRFFGLKRLNLHAMARDASKLHERLGYDLYRRVGVLAPRSSWAILKVNGESLGLFSMVEQVDGRFTADRFPDDGDGNLYKEAWPIDADASYYDEHLETDATDAAGAEHTVATTLAAELSQAADATELRGTLARYADLSYLARYMAVDDAIVNVDGVTATYTGSDPMYYQNHNYYLYLEQSEPRFWLIPWDLDATFTPRGDFERVPRWNAAETDCSISYPVWGKAKVVSPACDVVFQALAADQAGYQAAVDELLAGAFSEDALKADIDRHSAFIAEAVATDPLGPGTVSWQAAVTTLKQRVPVLRARLQSIRTGRSTSPFSLSVGAVNDFETADAASLILGVEALSNSRSTVSAFLNTTAPLAGTRDLRLDFVYRNEGDPPEPWGQWTYLPLRLEDAPRSLSELTGVRMLVRGDSPRTLRIDLDAAAYEASDEGIKFGWDVQIGPSPQPVELRFAEAALPLWARATADDRAQVLAAVQGLAFQPYCAGRDAAGLLPIPDGSDAGYLEIDEIEFF